jgi:hypothetical protein
MNTNMNRAKHTPGPWVVKHDSEGMPFIGVASDPIDYPGTVAVVDGGNPEEDARLIAACPDLLAALMEIATALEDARKNQGCTSEFCSGTCHYCANIRRARAAIAKAEGRE